VLPEQEVMKMDDVEGMASDTGMSREPAVAPLEWAGGRLDCGGGLSVPSDVAELSRWRLALREAVRDGAVAPETERARCARSLPYWVAAHGWTYRLREVGEDGRTRSVGVNVDRSGEVAETGGAGGRSRPAREPLTVTTPHYPFALYPIQVTTLQRLVSGIDNGSDVLLDKSRDMGCSWLGAALMAWSLLFTPESQMIVVSRVEDLVDRKGDPSTVMWKIRYLLQRCPEWLSGIDPARFSEGGDCSRHLSIVNPMNGSTIFGQASTGHVGRGGRTRFIVFDEYAAFEKAESAWQSAADTTACRIAISTPLGPQTHFSKLRMQGMASGSPEVITLGYWDHPEKGRGREWRCDKDGSVTGTVNRWYWWSPWFDREVERRADPLDVAQNILIDHVGSGQTFFNRPALGQHMREHGFDPRRCEWNEQYQRWEDYTDGRWFVWEAAGNKSLPHYVMFADPSYGLGRNNSAVAVVNVDTGKLAAMFVDPHVTPFELAEMMSMAGRGPFKGRYGSALIGWENNGPGGSMGSDLWRLEYPMLYRMRAVGQDHDKEGHTLGWTSTRASKRLLFSNFQRSLLQGEFICPCNKTLEEASEYVLTRDGGIESPEVADQSTGSKLAHGDRVIAAAGAVMLMNEFPAFLEDSSEFAPGTYGNMLGWDT
jgi:hypothetical protein